MTGVDRSQGRFSSTGCIFLLDFLFSYLEVLPWKGREQPQNWGPSRLSSGDSKSSMHHTEQQLVLVKHDWSLWSLVGTSLKH